MKERFEALLVIDNGVFCNLEFVKNPVLFITEEYDEGVGKTVNVYFTMTISKMYANDQTKRFESKYHARAMCIDFEMKSDVETESDVHWETEGLEGLQNDVAQYIIEQMKLRLK